MKRPPPTPRPDRPKCVHWKHGCYYFVDAKRKWHRLDPDYYTALARYAELNLARTARPTMAEVFVRYTRDVLPTKALLTQRQNLVELELLRKAFGHMLPEDIEPKHIYAYMDARQAPVRANREKALLSHVFRYAIRWGIANDNPCRLVISNKEKPRERYVTDEEFWHVHALAAPGVQRAMLLAITTGLRLSDILALGPQNLRADGLLVRTAKTGKALLFRWTPALREIVGGAATDTVHPTDVSLVVGVRGERFTRSGFQSVWQRLMIRAYPNKADRFTFHDLRAKAGSDSDDTRLLGHADLRTLNRHYRRKPETVQPVEINSPYNGAPHDLPNEPD